MKSRMIRKYKADEELSNRIRDAGEGISVESFKKKVELFHVWNNSYGGSLCN